MNLNPETTKKNTENTVPKTLELADELVEFTGSPDYRNFYLAAIRALGVGQARQAMGEVRMRENEGSVRDRGAYLTSVLKDWMVDEMRGEPSPGSFIQGSSEQGSFRQDSLVSFGQTVPLDSILIEPTTIQKIPIPFRKDYLQWAREINNDYFVLNNEVMKTDQVETTIWLKGQPYKVPMMRGKSDPFEEPRGLLTVGHMKSLSGVEIVWNHQGTPCIKDTSRGVVFGVIDTTLRELASALGISKGGSQSEYLRANLFDLWKSGYYYKLWENPDLKKMGLRGASFSFLSGVQELSRDIKGREEVFFRVFLSEAYTRQFLTRNVVSRPLDFPRIRNDIGFKLDVFLYPILINRPKGAPDFTINLKDLIPALGLKEAGWQSTKSQRKRQFEKGVKELNQKKAHDGRLFRLEIIQELNNPDFTLTARLDIP